MFIYDVSLDLFGKAGVNLPEAGFDMRLLLVMANSTAGVQRQALTLSGFTTLDEYGGTGYSRIALPGQTWTVNGDVHEAVFGYTSFQWATLGPGARSCIGAVLYRHVTTDSDSIPFQWFDEGGFPFVGGGGPVQWTPPAGGGLFLRQAT